MSTKSRGIPSEQTPESKIDNREKADVVGSAASASAATPTAESCPPNTSGANEQAPETDVIAQLRIPQNYAKKIGVKKAQAVFIRKPKNSEFFRKHPTMQPMLVGILVYEQDVFVVATEVADSLPVPVVLVELTPCITRQEALLLWPLRIPGDDGRINAWHASAREAAARSEYVWVRMQSNMSLGAYDVYEAVGAIPDPLWPDLTLEEIVRIAVKGHVIDSLDHPVIQKLRGEI